jgi:hypothetical protein
MSSIRPRGAYSLSASRRHPRHVPREPPRCRDAPVAVTHSYELVGVASDRRPCVRELPVRDTAGEKPSPRSRRPTTDGGVSRRRTSRRLWKSRSITATLRSPCQTALSAPALSFVTVSWCTAPSSSSNYSSPVPGSRPQVNRSEPRIGPSASQPVEGSARAPRQRRATRRPPPRPHHSAYSTARGSRSPGNARASRGVRRAKLRSAHARTDPPRRARAGGVDGAPAGVRSPPDRRDRSCGGRAEPAVGELRGRRLERGSSPRFASASMIGSQSSSHRSTRLMRDATSAIARSSQKSAAPET